MPKGYPKAKKPQRAAPQAPMVPQAPEQDDEAQFIPMHVTLDTMSQADLAQFAKRSFGRWPDESKSLPEQVAQVKEWTRGGNPFYAR